jgi:hypothetical protein
VTKHVKHVPQHRAARAPRAARATRRAVRSTLALSSVAVAATGAAVVGGVVHGPGAVSAATGEIVWGDAAGAALSGSAATVGSDRAAAVSRSSDRREPTDPAKEAALGDSGARAITVAEDLSAADPREIARAMLAQFGFAADQFSCLDSLWVSESDWRVDADNPSSSAYGIPQALTQLHDLPSDYTTSAASQIRWGLGYIRDSYGSPCSAWSFKQGHDWY